MTYVSEIGSGDASHGLSADHARTMARHRGRAIVAPDWRGQLKSMIASRIVPRLTSSRPADPQASLAWMDDEHIARFAAMTLTAPSQALHRSIGDLQSTGVSMEDILLHLLAPAAQRLGALWLADQLSFLDVTRGCSALQAVLRTLAPNFEAMTTLPYHGRKILLAPVPGEQHVFGLSMLASFFRRAGWDVTYEPRIGLEALAERVAREPFEAIGLTVAGNRFLDQLPRAVETVRRRSKMRDMVVLAGGPAFLNQPELSHAFEVDGVALDAPQAVSCAESLTRSRLPG